MAQNASAQVCGGDLYKRGMVFRVPFGGIKWLDQHGSCSFEFFLLLFVNNGKFVLINPPP